MFGMDRKTVEQLADVFTNMAQHMREQEDAEQEDPEESNRWGLALAFADPRLCQNDDGDDDDEVDEG